MFFFLMTGQGGRLQLPPYIQMLIRVPKSKHILYMKFLIYFILFRFSVNQTQITRQKVYIFMRKVLVKQGRDLLRVTMCKLKDLFFKWGVETYGKKNSPNVNIRQCSRASQTPFFLLVGLWVHHLIRLQTTRMDHLFFHSPSYLTTIPPNLGSSSKKLKSWYPLNNPKKGFAPHLEIRP
ncbi:hypothetical protein V6Z12_D04G168400 [Gossypium hirsutum]